jgi:RNA polymerase sigma-70 factor (ECF subfamily)
MPAETLVDLSDQPLNLALMNPSDLGDDVLARMIASRRSPHGDWQLAQQACEQLYHRHARRLLAFLSCRVDRGDVEDVHQAVWERVWRHLPEGFHGGNFRAWLYRIARNYLVDLRRKKMLQTPGQNVLAVPDKEVGVDVLMVEREQMAILRRCIELLSSDAATLVRARLSGEGYDEFCRRTGWKVERAHKLFHQAKEQLQTCVERATT